MKGFFKSKRIWLAAGAAALVLTASVGSAMAYFTDTTSAAGSQPIRLYAETTIEETFGSWTKTVTVTNTGNADVYVRVSAFAGDAYTLSFSGEGWTDGNDGYWYYDKIVPAGEEDNCTSELTIAIDGADENADFNVVVVQEAAPVVYDENGVATPGWD